MAWRAVRPRRRSPSVGVATISSSPPLATAGGQIRNYQVCGWIHKKTECMRDSKHVCVRMCVHVSVCVRMCARAHVCACMRACVCVSVKHVHFLHASPYVYACHSVAFFLPKKHVHLDVRKHGRTHAHTQTYVTIHTPSYINTHLKY